jgi:predicted Zn finger-like uncharacterized protein
MFTRCPTCRTVFYITAAELRAAEGAVVCGACGTTFDALESLSETRPLDMPPLEPAAEPAPDLPQAPDEHARDEQDFLEEVESLLGVDDLPDEPLGALAFPAGPPRGPHLPPAAASESEYADWHLLPAELTEDELREGALPEHAFADDDFIDDAPPDELLPDGASEDIDLMDDVQVAGEIEDDDFLDGIPDPDSVFLVDDEESVSAADLAQAGPIVALDEAGAEPEEMPLVDGGLATRRHGSGTENDEAATPAALPAHLADQSDAVPEFAWEQPPRWRWLKVLLPLIAVLGLAGTWIHTQHGQLLRHPVGEAVLAPLYRLLGVDVAPDWNPGDFRVLRSEAVADTGLAGRLRVSVEFMNAAAFAQPHPVIRVVLQDRFGRRVGAQDFTPGDYLKDHRDGSRMQAGARLQASVVVPDPEARADGFRVSLCLDLDSRGLVCAAEQLP